MKKAFLLSLTALSLLAAGATAQTKVDRYGKMERHSSGFITINNTKAHATAEEILGCPEGTVLGGEYKDNCNESGLQSSDQGRPDYPSKVYQSFSECYQTVNGLRVIGTFNYFNDEGDWVPCHERGGITADSPEMTEAIDFNVEFYTMGDDGKPGEKVYSKTIPAIGEYTGVMCNNEYHLYTFHFDLGETLSLERGFFSVAAADKGDAPSCWFALFCMGSVPGYGLTDLGGGSLTYTFLPACYCLKGNGDFIAGKALKVGEVEAPAPTASGKYEKVRVELTNIGQSTISDATLELWDDDRLLATEEVGAEIGTLDTYSYQFKYRIDCSKPGTSRFSIRNVTPGDEHIAAEEVTFETSAAEEQTSCTSESDDCSYEHISTVRIGDITCNSDATTYSDFTDMQTTIHPGDVLELDVTAEGANYRLFWIDWNGDGNFDDEGEETGVIAEGTANVVIPENVRVTPGKKLLRIIASYEPVGPCGSYYYGETEDYTIVVEYGDNAAQSDCPAAIVDETVEGDASKSVSLDLGNKGDAVLTASLSAHYLLPGSPATGMTYRPDRYTGAAPQGAPRLAQAKERNGAPQDGADTKFTLRYDNGLYASIAVANYDVATHATYYPATMLSPLAGMTISSVDVYISSAAQKSSVVIFGQGTQKSAGAELTSQEFTPAEHSWNRVVLDNPVTIGNEDIWIGVRLEGFEADRFYIGTDFSTAVKGYGDLINIGGDKWWSLGELGTESNFCIRANVAGDDKPVISWLTIGSRTMEVEPGSTGRMDFTLDGAGLEPGLYEAVVTLTTNDLLAQTITIPVYLTKGDAVTAINDARVIRARMEIGGGRLRLTADGMTAATLTDMAGRTRSAATAHGGEAVIDLSRTASGICVLAVDYADGTRETVKLPIRR